MRQANKVFGERKKQNSLTNQSKISLSEILSFIEFNGSLNRSPQCLEADKLNITM